MRGGVDACLEVRSPCLLATVYKYRYDSTRTHHPGTGEKGEQGPRRGVCHRPTRNSKQQAAVERGGKQKAADTGE